MKKLLLILALIPSLAIADTLIEDEPTAALRRLPIKMVDDTDHFTEETGLTVTCTISKNGASYAAGGGSVTEVGNGDYYYAASVGDVDTPGFLLYRCTASGADTFTGRVLVLEIHDGTAQAGAASTITLESNASSTNDIYNNRLISIDQGTGAGQTRCITDYVGSTKVATISPNWTTNPSSDSEYLFGGNCNDGLDISVLSATDVKAAVQDYYDDVPTELASCPNPASATREQMLQFVYHWFAAKKDKSSASSLEQIYDYLGTTVLCERPYSDSAGVRTLGKYVTP